MTDGRCDFCGNPFKRKHVKQRFCSPVKGRHLCKDRFHNREQFRRAQEERERYDPYDVYMDTVHPMSEEAFSV